MEIAEKLIAEEAPPDDSTYFNAESASKEKLPDAQGIEPFPIAQIIQEASLNE